MAYAISGIVRDSRGVPVPDALVYVYSPQGGLASLFNDLGSPIENPLAADGNGLFEGFATEQGYHTLSIHYGGRERATDEVLLGSEPIARAEATATALVTYTFGYIGDNAAPPAGISTGDGYVYTIAGRVYGAVKTGPSAGEPRFEILTVGTLGSADVSAAITYQFAGASTRPLVSRLSDRVSVKDYGATGTGANANAAFAAAASAANGREIFVPAGQYLLTTATPSGFWVLDPGAKILGLADIGVPTVSVISDTSRLTGKMVQNVTSVSFGPTTRIGDTRGWLEKTVRGSTESYATLPVINGGGGIAITGASRTSDSPDTLNTAMSCIGGNFYAINDSPKSTGQTVYSMYAEAQRLAGCGMVWGMEMDVVNFGPDTLDIKPSTPLIYDGYTSGIVLNSGGGHPGAIPASVAYTVQYNGSTFRRGLVFNSGCLDGVTNEAIAMSTQHRIAWYDSNGARVGFMDGSYNERIVDSSGLFYVTDASIRKGGSGAASPINSVVYRNEGYGWTGAAKYLGAFSRIQQRTSFSAGNARFSYDIGAITSAGTEIGVSLNGIADNTFGPFSDNTIALGGSGNRWSVVYAGTGAINTSDEREKVWQGGPSAADKRAAKRILAELGWYKWAASIEDKGQDARLHYGVRAQAVARILMEEGIEATQNLDISPSVFVPESQRPSFRSAFLVFTTWDDEYRDDFAQVDDVEEIDVVMTQDVPTGESDGEGNPVTRPEKVMKKVSRPVKRSVATGTRTKIKSAGNTFGVRPDQLTLYLLSALVTTD